MFNRNGFSIVSVMVAAGILGVVALGVATLAENMGKIKQDAYSVMDEANLKQAFSAQFFRAPQVPPGAPESFNGCKHTFENIAIPSKTAHDNYPKPANGMNPTEGIAIQNLYLASQDGTARGQLFLTSSNGQVIPNKFGSLTILGIRLFFENDPNNPTNFNGNELESPEAAYLNIYYEKNFGVDQNGVFKKQRVMKIPFTAVVTRMGGNYVIDDCNGSGLGEEQEMLEEMACIMANKFYNKNSTPPCKPSKGIGKMLTLQGGQGGRPSSLRCPQGLGIIGIYGHHGSRVETLGIICKEINYETLTPDPGGFFYYSTLAGVNDSGSLTAFTDYCQNGSFASGLKGREGALIDAIGLHCRRFDTNVAQSGTVNKGGGGGNPFSEICNPDTILREILVRSGAEIDSVRGACW